MKIRTQLAISILLFCVALLIVAAAVVMTNQQVDQINRQQDLVKNIELGAGELGYLSNDYLLYHESYQLDRWNAKYAEISGDVANLSVNTPEQQALVNTIKASQLRLNDVFNNVVSTLKDENPAGDNSADKAYIQVSWNRLAVQTRGMIFDASRLEQMLEDEQNQVKQTGNLFIMALLGAFGAFILIDFLLVFGSAIRSIGNLQAGTKVIGSGNLDYTIKAKKGDEVGDLAEAFNQMTARLKTVTASKNDLEKEIAERKLAEASIRRQADLIDLSPDAIMVIKPDGTITFWSRGAETLYGYTRDAAIGKNVHELLNKVLPEPLDEIIAKLSDKGHWTGEMLHTTADGHKVTVQSRWLAQFDQQGRLAEILESNVDVTERKRVADEQEITVGFLRIVNESKGLEDMIKSITSYVQDKSGCEAVGIRLRHGDDYPYYETRGFPKDFVLAETHLCLQDNAGLPQCDSDGYPILECMCGNVIRGRFDPSKPFFTARGSFWSNNTTQLLATTTEQDRQARTRNRCNGEGYESVAVIAIRLGTECLGTLQMNDHQIGRFTPESIAMWERLTDNLAVALAKFEADRALRESEEKYRELVENANSIIIRWGIDGRIRLFNEFAEQFFGYHENEVLGKDVTMLIPRTDTSGRDLQAMVEDIKLYPEQYLNNINENVLKSGEHRWVMWTNRAVRDESGNIREILAVGTDITELRHAEEAREQLLAELKQKTAQLQDVNEEVEVKNEELAAQSEELECANEELRTHNEELQTVSKSLRETQDYLENLINYANAPIIVWDPAFIITRFNRAFERLSGYTADEVIGKNLSLLFPPDSKDESLDLIKKTLAGEQWESVEIPILHKYGSIRIALWNSANIYDDSHNMVATIAQGQDITRRKQTEKELAEAKTQAELYLDLMGHDISNMHQIMMMQLELAADILKMEGNLQDNDRELIDTALQTLNKAARLINNVRKLQKHQAGEFTLEPVDLNAILEEVLKDYSSLPGKDVTVRYSPDGRNMVRGNPLLKDVFSNIVDNAVKHTTGPLVLAVNISKISQNGSAFYRVAIEDNGSGIPDDKKDEVFHRFKRGQTKARGTGLGLYIVKTLVESFGGYVEIQNRVLDDYTQGTRFLVYLPAAEGGDDGNR